MFFTDVNKFTLTCDLNFQKKKKIKGQEKERREERRMRKERKAVG